MVKDGYTQELADEQGYFDAARGAYDESLVFDDPKRWGVGNGPDRRAMKKEVEKRERLAATDGVAFGRMDLDDGESYYIGKVPISNDNRDKLVISWKSKVGASFYQATAHDRCGVARKRDFTTTGNHVDAFTDKVLAQIAKDVATLEDEIRSDDALLHSLAASRTGQMQDIVRTIQASQDKLMRLPKDQLLVIQGGPGTGKTAVALHRASWLLYNYREELAADDMLVVGPNPAFTKYIQQILPGLGDAQARQTSVQELLAGDLPVRSQEPDKVARIKGLAEMADVIARGLDDRIKVPIAALRITRRNSAATVTVTREMVAPDIQRLRSEPYGKGRDELKARLLVHCATAAGLRPGTSAVDVMDPRSVDAALDRMWPQLSAAQFVRELLGSKPRLRSAASDLLKPEEIELLHRGAAERISDEPWTLADLALIDEAEDNMSDKQPLWGHIIVDEAQDLTPLELFALRRRSRNGSMTLVGDVAQSTGPFARQDWDDVVDALRSRLPSSVEELKHGYRVPKEVFDVARRLLPIAAPGMTPPTIVRSANADPELFDVVRGQLAREVARVASHHSSKGRFVGVIAPKELWEEVQLAFGDAGLQWSDSSTGQLGRSINLVTPAGSKGLEFDAVVVVDPAAILAEDNGARLLYIALTRTTSRLDVIAPAGEIPQIIRDGFPKITVIDDPEPVARDQKPTEPLVKDLDDPVMSEDEQPVQAPTSGATAPETAHVTEIPASTAKQFPKPVADLRATDESSRQVFGRAPLGAVEQELVARNAQYLVDIVMKMYGPEIRRPILEVALRRLAAETRNDNEGDGSQ